MADDRDAAPSGAPIARAASPPHPIRHHWHIVLRIEEFFDNCSARQGAKGRPAKFWVASALSARCRAFDRSAEGERIDTTLSTVSRYRVRHCGGRAVA